MVTTYALLLRIAVSMKKRLRAPELFLDDLIIIRKAACIDLVAFGIIQRSHALVSKRVSKRLVALFLPRCNHDSLHRISSLSCQRIRRRQITSLQSPSRRHLPRCILQGHLGRKLLAAHGCELRPTLRQSWRKHYTSHRFLQGSRIAVPVFRGRR